MNKGYMGWDVGGAHLKVAKLVADESNSFARQLPCPLWLGMSHLRKALTAVLEYGGCEDVRHAVTMSGEMVDCFPDRDSGVRAILACLQERLGEFAVYSWRSGLLTRAEAVKRCSEVASANWHATASALAKEIRSGTLVDIGSTTTDIVPFAGGRALATAKNDCQRLAYGELLYSGVVRTPLSALADSCFFRGERAPMVAEAFAATADVWRICGVLPDDADLLPSCDDAAKTPRASARRLARMFARDYEDEDFDEWRKVARFFACAQTHRVKRAIAALRSRFSIADDAPIVGAGSGSFIAERVARECGWKYMNFSDCVAVPVLQNKNVSEHASAVALAVLLRRDQFA